MAKPARLRDLVPKDDLPAAAVTQQFITFYINHRDLKLAACQAGLMPSMGARLYREPKVRERIDKKLLLLDVEEAKLKAKANLLTVNLLDASLAEEVRSKKNGNVRVRAIELGYRRTGLIKDGEFYVAPDPSANINAPSIYRAQQTTMRQTVTTEVTHTDAQVIPQQPDPIFAVQEY